MTSSAGQWWTETRAGGAELSCWRHETLEGPLGAAHEDPSSPAGVRNDELGRPLCGAERGEPPLHCHRAHLALRHLHLQDNGAGGGGRERLGGREVCLHLQHAAARLQQRLLRPLLPHLPHPPVGPAAHPRHHASPAGGHARGLPAAPGEEAADDDGARGRQAPGGGEEAQDTHRGLVVVDVCLQRGLQAALRGSVHVHLLHDLPGLPDGAAGQVRGLPLPQHRRLLRLPAHREDHLHRLHAGHLQHLHRAQHGRAGLPGGAGLRPPGPAKLQPLVGEGLFLRAQALRVQAERDQPAADGAGRLPQGHAAPQPRAAGEGRPLLRLLRVTPQGLQPSPLPHSLPTAPGGPHAALILSTAPPAPALLDSKEGTAAAARSGH